MKKKRLSKIAKRIAKTMLMQAEASVMLDTTKLTEDEVDYVSGCMKRIAEKITDEQQESDIEKIVSEGMA